MHDNSEPLRLRVIIDLLDDLEVHHLMFDRQAVDDNAFTKMILLVLGRKPHGS